MKAFKYYTLIILIFVVYLFVCVKYRILVLRNLGIYSLIKTANRQLFEFNSDEIFTSDCACRNESKIKLSKFSSFYLAYTESNKILLNITKNEFDNLIFTCGFYKSLLRGPRQKVISYSLYGKNNLYYDQLKKLSHLIKSKYPDWLMRIYHDDSIDSSIICELDCLEDNNNVDFCDVNNLPIKNSMLSAWSLSYLHAMAWRWLPIGDSFVDIFSSRDLDSLITQREIDSVNVWLESDKTAHIMRDNIGHGTEMLGGMWGFYNARDRFLSFHLLNLIVFSRKYNYGKANLKGYDQFFLATIYSLLKDSAVIHDSYTCEIFGGQPFPSRREGDCFVGGLGECNRNGSFRECPVKCRPKMHLDWTTC